VPRSEVNCQLTLIGAFEARKSVLVDDEIDPRDPAATPAPRSPSPSTAPPTAHDVGDKIFKDDSDVLRALRSAEKCSFVSSFAHSHQPSRVTGDAETFAKLPRALQQKERKTKSDVARRVEVVKAARWLTGRLACCVALRVR
jgi:hypothetical protein